MVDDSAGVRRSRKMKTTGFFVVLIVALVAIALGLPRDGGRLGRVDGPVLVAAESNGMLAEIVGEVTYDGDCIRLGDHVILWPPGTRWEDGRVVMADGTVVRPGDQIEAGGGSGSARAWSDDVTATLARHCAGPDARFAALNKVTVIESP